jgi:hypothetical protein
VYTNLGLSAIFFVRNSELSDDQVHRWFRDMVSDVVRYLSLMRCIQVPAAEEIAMTFLTLLFFAEGLNVLIVNKVAAALACDWQST